MKEFFRNWNYAKHACAVTGLYVVVSTIGNLILGTPKKLKQAEIKRPKKCISSLSKKEKIFNGVVAGCYIFDMTATYGIVKLIQKKCCK